MIAFLCSNCGAQLRVKTNRAGKIGRCPRCKKSVEAPSADSIPAPGSGAYTPIDPEEDTSPTLPDQIGLEGELGAVFEPQTTHSARDLAFLAPPQAPDELGRLGPYRILEVLGAGGMGIVFQAEDVQLRRQVALKAMKADLAAKEGDRQRFLREAQAAAALDHEHIVTVYQVGEDRGIPYLAMKLLQGESLEDRLNRSGGRLPLAEVLRIGREIAEGLAAAHAKGLVHRDVKPDNIWLEGDRGHVRLVDFGLARGPNEEGHVTQAGMIVGTPAYMAPEQAGAQPIDHRSDLFSLGCVLYRMSTGQLPFQGKSTLAMLMALASKTPKPPDSLEPDLPASFSDLVMKLLRKNREARPPSAQAVARALERIEQAPCARPPSSGQQRAARTGRPGRAEADEVEESMEVERVEEAEDEEVEKAGGRPRPSRPKDRRRPAGPRKKKTRREEEAEAYWERKVMTLAVVVGIAVFGLIVFLIVRHIIQKSSAEDQSARPVHFAAGTVKTTSAEPVLPAASRTRSTTTYAPGFSTSVWNLNVSAGLSNRPSVGKTLTHFLPLTANDAAVSRANGERAVASSITRPLAMPAVLM